MFLYKDPFVKFHAIQSIFGLGLLGGVGFIFTFVPLLGSVVLILYFLMLLGGAYKASQGIMWEMPVVGKLAKKAIMTS